MIHIRGFFSVSSIFSFVITTLIFAFATEIVMLLVIKCGPSYICLYRAKKRTPTLRY